MGLHTVGSSLARWAVRNPKYSWFCLVLGPGLLGLLAFIFLPAINLGLAPPPQGATIDMEILAPGQVESDAFAKELNAATDAEKDRIAELGFVIRPQPYSMPVLIGRVPGLSDGAAFTRIVRRMEAIGCVDDDDQVNQQLDIDEDAVAELEAEIFRLNPGASGLALLRQNYHLGLLAFCKGDFASAQRAFGQVAGDVADGTVSGPVAEQFRYVGVAGQRMALIQTGGAAQAEMPTLPLVLGALENEQSCRQDSSGGQCRLFEWPSKRTGLSLVHEFLATSGADPADFAAAISDGFDGAGNLASYNYAAFVAAHAKAGQFELVRERVRSAAPLVATWRDDLSASSCVDIDRMAALGWIAGMDVEDIESCSGFPYASDLSPEDASRILSWESIHAARQSLLQGDLKGAGSDLAGSRASPDDQAFHARAGEELFERVAERLHRRVAEAPSEGLVGVENKVTPLLRSGLFSWQTRVSAEYSAMFGSIWIGLAILVVAALALGALGWLLWNLLLGYALAFTQRHHLELRSKAG